MCEYTSTLRLPQLPEMIFPNNSLTVTYRADPTKSIVFDALDALRMVNADSLPDVKVGDFTTCGMRCVMGGDLYW